MSILDLPQTARPGSDAPVGQDELGRTLYRTVTGELYTMPDRPQMPAPTMTQRLEGLGGLASRAYENLSVENAIETAKGIGGGILSGLVQGFTAPGRALSGEPVTMGDVMATAGMAQGVAAPMRAPEGSLRSGSFRVYQGSPHDFNAERLVRYPDGRTEYIVGRPDVLPDVPAGAEVLQDFPLGRQRMDKIGTGEGAQAYGYGLYGAENEGIARGYRDALTDPDAVPLQFDGRPVNTPWNEEIRERWPEYFSNLSETDADAMEELLGNLSQVNNIADVQNVLGGVSSRAKVLYSRIVKPKLVKPDVGAGRMYELNINANPEDFLDWDKPLSEQPNVLSRLGYSTMDENAIQEEAARIMEAMPGGAWMNDPASKARIDELQAMLDRKAPSGTGQDLYRGGASDDVSGILSQMGYGDPAAQSQALREAGIPGIRYLDAGSRAAGDGSRNYVVFDENLISIVRKYGIAGAAAMLGVSAVDVEQALADNLPQSQWDQLVVGPK